MSSPRLPVEIVSISIFSRLPSFIAEPLPNARSICASAASSAFCRSIAGSFQSAADYLELRCHVPDLLRQCERHPLWRPSPAGDIVYPHLFRENNREHRFI